MRFIALALLTSCPTALNRTVQSLSQSGDYENATTVVLSAAAAGDKEAQELLPTVAEDAYADLLDRGREAEADDDLPAALGYFDAARALEARVVEAGGPPLPSRIATERADIAQRTAILHAARASVAYDEQRYADALAGWRLAEGTDAEATTSELLIPKALARLGDVARTNHEYREAIALYDEAVEAGGGEDPRIWSAAIHAALGRYALKQGACRQAVEELTQASALPFDIRLSSDLERAKDCAIREVVVHPLDDLVEGGIDKVNLGVLLIDQLNHHLNVQGSGYLRLLAADSRAAKAKVTEPRQRYEVTGHLTRIEVGEQPKKSRQAEAVGAIKVPCSPGTPPECLEDVRVSYTLTTERIEVDVAGAIKVIDVASGVQVATKPLDVRLSRTRYEASKAKATDVRGFGLQAPVGETISDRSIGVKGDERQHFTPTPELPDPDKVVDEAVVRLAAEAAEAILAAVDVEDPLDDPDTLILVTPVARAEDLTFGSAEIEEDTVDDIVIGGDGPTEENVPDPDAGPE